MRGWAWWMCAVMAASACDGADPESVDAGQPDAGSGDAATAGPEDAGSEDAGTAVELDGGLRADAGAPVGCAAPGERAECELEGFAERPYLVHVPSSHDGVTPLPIVVVFHGGGGTAEGGERSGCPDGDASDPACLHAVGERMGFATVYANGTANPARPGRFRTWNAGGGADGFDCVSAYACDNNIDDIAYVNALLDDLERWLPSSPTRTYAAGLSNGAAMSHRVACELADRFVAVAPIGGGNQFETAAPCTPSQPVGVLYVHGTVDTCWPYDGGPVGGCSAGGMPGPPVVSVSDSMTSWAARNGCEPTPDTLDGPERVDDGIRVEEDRYRGCSAPVVHYRVIGGGHTWVSGQQYFPAARIGPTFFDVTNEDLWSFFDSVRR